MSPDVATIATRGSEAIGAATRPRARMSEAWCALVVPFAVAFAVAAGASEPPSAEPAPAPLQEVVVPSPTGGAPLALVDAEKATLLVFWSLWCEPCDRELAELASLEDELGSAGIRAIALYTDGEEFVDRVPERATERGWPFPIGVDDQMTLFRRLTDGRVIPSTVALGPDGSLIYQKSGYEPGDIERAIAEIQAVPAEAEREASPRETTPDATAPDRR